jgi:hypothetical protein
LTFYNDPRTKVIYSSTDEKTKDQRNQRHRGMSVCSMYAEADIEYGQLGSGPHRCHHSGISPAFPTQ